MFSPETKRKIFRIIPFGVIWLIFGISYSLIEKGLLDDLTHYPSTGNPYNFGGNTIAFLILVAVTGLLVGTIEIMFLNSLFNTKSFGKKLFYKSSIYVLIIAIFLLITTLISNIYILQADLLDNEIWKNVWTFLTSFAYLSIVVYVSIVIGISLFFSEVSENLGISVLHNYFLGKYHKPIQEERIFMFLDMRSSTTIAEKIGHVKYFEMLKDYYKDLSYPIVQYHGEVYQYVGDEIIVSWKLKNGIQDNNCLKCFFAMKESIIDHSEKYQSKYGILPSFKAGFHYGKVTTGEIGVLKKDIIFSGDVLNATARIQGLCNNYNVDILISDQLKNKMDIESDFTIQSLGIHELRGRNETIKLFTVGSLNGY